MIVTGNIRILKGDDYKLLSDMSLKSAKEIIDGIDKTNNTTLILDKSLGLTDKDMRKLIPYLKEKIPNLTSLSITGNKLTEIPEGIEAFTSLEKLDLSSNKIKEPFDRKRSLSAIRKRPAVTFPKSVNTLVLDDNPIKSLEGGGSKLDSLTGFSLVGCGLKKFPVALQLSLLKKLDISRNRITELPLNLSFMDVKELNLSHNPFSTIPMVTTSFASLARLEMNNCNLSNTSFGKLNLKDRDWKMLQILFLNDNELTELPQGLIHLKRLKTMSFDNNLVDLGMEVTALENKLKERLISRTPFTPQENLQRYFDSTKNWNKSDMLIPSTFIPEPDEPVQQLPEGSNVLSSATSDVVEQRDKGIEIEGKPSKNLSGLLTSNDPLDDLLTNLHKVSSELRETILQNNLKNGEQSMTTKDASLRSLELESWYISDSEKALIDNSVSIDLNGIPDIIEESKSVPVVGVIPVEQVRPNTTDSYDGYEPSSGNDLSFSMGGYSDMSSAKSDEMDTQKFGKPLNSEKRAIKEISEKVTLRDGKVKRSTNRKNT